MDAEKWHRLAAQAECIGVYCFGVEIHNAPRWMTRDEVWAWDMGYRLARFMRVGY